MIIPFLKALPLDVVKGAVATYSLRRLKSSYNGKCIRVRRDSDDTEFDIGFSGIGLDIPSLLSFVGAGSGYVKTWYDQSVNNNNATQTTLANQPRIINNGILHIDINGKVSIESLLTNNQYFVVTHNSTIAFTTNMTSIFVHSPYSGGGNNSGRIWDKSVTMQMNNNNNLTFNGQAATAGVVSINTLNINTVTHDSNANQAKFYKNGILNDTKTSALINTGTGNLYILNNSTLVRPYDGLFSELILFSRTLSDIERQKIERNQGKYYGISVL